MIIAPKTGLLVPMPLSRQSMPAALEVLPTDPHFGYWQRRLRSKEVAEISKEQATQLLDAAAKVKAERKAVAANAATDERTAADKSTNAETDKVKASTNAGGAK
jgi:hypothetical protein